MPSPKQMKEMVSARLLRRSIPSKAAVVTFFRLQLIVGSLTSRPGYYDAPGAA